MRPCSSLRARSLFAVTLGLALLVGLTGACRPPASADARPEAVILLIGDGFGFGELTLARNLLVGLGNRLELEKLPVTGIVTTYSASNAVTDSGAAATAFASGVKTDNQYIGLDSQRKRVRSLGELARAKGWRVGLVTTTRVTHATPAAFYGHVPDRYADEGLIAEQLLEARFDLVMGGGLSFFLPKEKGGLRTDGRDLTVAAEQAGYALLRRGDPLQLPADGRIVGLFANSHLAYTLDDRNLPAAQRDPELVTLSRLALDFLARDGKPFFLLIEGGKIDHAAHEFDAAGVVAETGSFDRAVAEVLAFQRRNPRTLVLLTADHSTGGLAINDWVNWEAIRRQTASVGWMASQILNAGAGVELVAEKTGFQDITPAEIENVRQAHDIYEACRRLGWVLAGRNGVTWLPRVNEEDTKGHTGEDVALFAGGPGAERFQGVLDNHEIPLRIATLLGWEKPN